MASSSGEQHQHNMGDASRERRARAATLSYVIMQLEAIDQAATDVWLSTESNFAVGEYRKGVAARVDDLGETLHRIATSWRRSDGKTSSL